MPSILTANGIAKVNAGDLNLKPVVQVMDVKAIGSGDRYRILVSDGSETQQALLATQLNDVVKGGRLKVGSVVQLVDYICNTVQDRRIIVVLNLEVIIAEGVASVNRASGSIPPSRLNANSSTNRVNNPPSFNPTVQPSYKPTPNYRNHGAIMKNEAPPRIIPIATLNPYQGRWAIKARVTAKGELRRYNNARGDGKVFSFDLLDSDGGEIRATCFNAVVDRFYDVVEAGKVYLISKGTLKPAQKNFNHLSHQWEIFLEATSTVELCVDEDNCSIPEQQFNFKLVSEIENVENNSILDVIGIVTSANPSTTILRKNGMETQRKVLNLKDLSDRSVEITLWGDFCGKVGREVQEILDSGNFPVVAVKAGKVSDFSGKSVGTISATQLFINPNFPEAVRLREWFDGGGKHFASQSISKDAMPGTSRMNDNRKNVSQIKDEGLGRGEKPDWVTIKAVISFVKTDNFCYTACPLMTGDKQCSKKVTRVSNGKWCCDRCDEEFEECDYRYLLQAQIQDHSGVTWVTAFQESGEEILGCSARELHDIKNGEGGDVRFADIIRRGLFLQYLFKLKIKEELYGDEQRLKVTVVKAEKVNPSVESRYLLDLIAKM